MKKLLLFSIFIFTQMLTAQSNSHKTSLSVCGNGIVEEGEECDGTPGCTSGCTLIPSGTFFVDPSYGIKNNTSLNPNLKTANRAIKLNLTTNAFFMTTNWNYEGQNYAYGGSTSIDNAGVIDYQWYNESSNGGVNLNKNFPLPIIGDNYVSNLIGEGINLKGIDIRQITNPSVLKTVIIPFDIAENDFDIFAATMQSDGKMLLAGRCISSLGRMIVIRLNTDFTFDTTFNSVGYVKLGFGSDCQARAIGVQSSGKIIVAGHRVSPGSQGIVLRLNTDGSMDTTFGVNGYNNFYFEVTTQDNFYSLSSLSEVYSLHITSADNIYLCGTGSTTALWNGKSIPAFRGYTANGANWIGMSDVTHTTATSLLNVDGSAYTILANADESFYLGGFSTAANNKGLYLQQFDSLGNIDTNFNFKSGTAPGFYDLSTGDDVIYDMVKQNDGKIILVGESNNKGFYTRIMDTSLATASFNLNAIKPKLWPNPVVDKLHLDFEQPLSAAAQISIIDVFGKQVYQLSNPALTGSKSLEINLVENLSSGVYLLKIQSGNQSQQLKFIKK